MVVSKAAHIPLSFGASVKSVSTIAGRGSDWLIAQKPATKRGVGLDVTASSTSIPPDDPSCTFTDSLPTACAPPIGCNEKVRPGELGLSKVGGRDIPLSSGWWAWQAP
eukprot:2808613-Prymnesium_polylepis.2